MGQPPTAAPGSTRARWVIAASIAILLAVAAATLLRRDDGSTVATTRPAPSSTEPVPSAPTTDAAPSDPDEDAPATTSTSAVAPPSTTVAEDPTPAAEDHGAALRNRTYESVSVQEDSTERTITDGAAVRLQFEGTADGDLVRWRISCNSGGGNVTASADRLTIEETGSSAASCGEARDADDTWIGSFFGTDPGWTLDGSRLVLRSGDTVITLDEVPADRFGSS